MRSGAGVGNACRVVKLPHPDRAVVESSSSGLERTGAPRFDTGSTRIHRLGRASSGVRGPTTDGRTRVERTRCRGVGRPEDRRARCSRCAVVVGACRAPCRTGRGCAAVELARPASCLVSTCIRARAQRHRRHACRWSRGLAIRISTPIAALGARPAVRQRS